MSSAKLQVLFWVLYIASHLSHKLLDLFTDKEKRLAEFGLLIHGYLTEKMTELELTSSFFFFSFFTISFNKTFPFVFGSDVT